MATKKGYKNTDLSTTQCQTPGCTNRIKKRLRRLPNPYEYCYSCYCDQEAKRGHFIGQHGRGKFTKENTEKGDKNDKNSSKN